jgi:hypothetical protein
MSSPSPPKATNRSIAARWAKLTYRLQVLENLYGPSLLTETFADAGPLAQDVDLIRNGKLPKQIRIGVGGTLNVTYPGDTTDTIFYQGGDVDRISPKTIHAAGTTAEKITVYW